MQIGVTTKCTTDVQVESGDEHKTTAKSDSDFCFLPTSSGYWRYYLTGKIQTRWWGPWSFGTGSHTYWALRGWRLNIVRQKWMMNRDSDGTSWYNFMRVKKLTDGRLYLCWYLAQARLISRASALCPRGEPRSDTRRESTSHNSVLPLYKSSKVQFRIAHFKLLTTFLPNYRVL